MMFASVGDDYIVVVDEYIIVVDDLYDHIYIICFQLQEMTGNRKKRSI